MGKNILYFVIAAVVLALVGGLIFFFTQQRQEESRRSPVPMPVQTQEEQGGLGSQLYENPGAKVSETNPFEAETNPFQGYKNPFE